jgi:DNA gyrase subunit A
MVVTERALGKCSQIDDYRVQKRGGKGIKTVNRTEKTGDVVALMEVLPEDEIMLITRGGQIIRSPVKDVRVAGRNTQGVKLMNLDMGDLVTAVARVVPDETEGEEGGDEEGDDSSPDAQLELTEEE